MSSAAGDSSDFFGSADGLGCGVADWLAVGETDGLDCGVAGTFANTIGSTNPQNASFRRRDRVCLTVLRTDK